MTRQSILNFKLRDIANKLTILFEDIKIQHTVFALPFAVMSAFLAANGFPGWVKLLWIFVAMFGARNSAMAFNRLVDAGIDKKNPRTRDRALASGKIGSSFYILFLLVSSGIFIFASYMLNMLAFKLSPLALAIVFFYSLTKRFTAYSHLYLGFALSVAPVGAWVAVREEISFLSLLLGAAVVFWLAGFDIIYACLDVESDRKNHLHSIPQQFGPKLALKLAMFSHFCMIIFLLALLMSPLLGIVYVCGVVLVAGLLWYEHSLVRESDLSKVNVAFFNVNGIISILLMIFVIVDCLWT